MYKNGFAFPREDVNVMMGNATLADLGAGVNNLGAKSTIGTLSGPGQLSATGGAGNSSQAFAEAAAADGGLASTSALNLSTAPDWVAFDRQVRAASPPDPPQLASCV